jgi:hypothetical protein
MRMLLTSQLLQASTQLCQQSKVEQTGQGEISRLADAINKLAEVTQLAKLETPAISKLDEDEVVLTNAVCKIQIFCSALIPYTMQEKIIIQNFCRRTNVKYETEFDEDEFRKEYPAVACPRFVLDLILVIHNNITITIGIIFLGIWHDFALVKRLISILLLDNKLFYLTQLRDLRYYFGEVPQLFIRRPTRGFHKARGIKEDSGVWQR